MTDTGVEILIVNPLNINVLFLIFNKYTETLYNSKEFSQIEGFLLIKSKLVHFQQNGYIIQFFS